MFISTKYNRTEKKSKGFYKLIIVLPIGLQLRSEQVSDAVSTLTPVDLWDRRWRTMLGPPFKKSLKYLTVKLNILNI